MLFRTLLVAVLVIPLSVHAAPPSGGRSSASGSRSGGGARFGGSPRASTPSASSSHSSGPRFGGSSVKPPPHVAAPPSHTAGSVTSGSRFGGSTTGGHATGSKSTAVKPSTRVDAAHGAPPPPKFLTPKVNQVGAATARARQTEASRAAMVADRPPTVTTSSGKSVRLDPVVSRVKPEHSSTRTTRVTRVYNVHHYGGWTSHSYQSDPYHPMLTGFLLGRLSSPVSYGPTRDWVYTHYDTMDPVRREELLRENTQLRDDIQRMRAERATVATAELSGVDPDLLYNDQTAAVVYHGTGWNTGRIIMWMLAVGLGLLLVYCVFFWRTQTFAALVK